LRIEDRGLKIKDRFTRDNAILNLRFSIFNPQSAIHNPQSTIQRGGLIMLIRFTLFLAFICALSPAPVGAVVVQPGDVAQEQTRNWVSKRDGVWTWNRSENGNSLELTVRGEVEFNDDYTEVRRLTPGSSLELRERRGGVSRRLEIEAGQGGGLRVSYFVDGQSRPYDAEAKAWFARVLDEAVTESGFNAGPRAQKILKERGASGLLDEVSRFKSDHVKHLYFQELFKSGSLDGRSAIRALGIAAREMASDHYKAQVLSGLTGPAMRDEAARIAYLEASGTIRSDHYRAQTLSTVLKQGNISKEALSAALRAARGISSDHYKTQVLLGVAENSLDDAAMRSAFVETAATINSDHYRAQALMALLSKGSNSKETLLVALKAAAGMSSDHYKAQTLLKLAGDRSGDETIRAALIDAARTIKSDHERGRVLSAIFK
jgi:hypothetical protein